MNLLVKFFCARRGAEAHSDLRRIMTDRYLTTVLKEAERVAEQHDQVARTADNQAHEYLRYAVLRVRKRGGPPPVGLDADRRRKPLGMGRMRRCSTVGAPAKTGGKQSRPRKRVPASACSPGRPPDGSP